MIYFFHGPPCTGKTTLSKIVSNRLNIPRVSTDMIRGEYSINYSIDNADEVFIILVSKIGQLIRYNSVVAEGLLISCRRREILTKSFNDIVFIRCNSPLNLCIERLQRRCNNPISLESSNHVYLNERELEKYYERYEYIERICSLEKEVVLDTSTQIDLAVNTIVNIIS